jgi:hypothetical protein
MWTDRDRERAKTSLDDTARLRLCCNGVMVEKRHENVTFVQEKR